MFDQILMKHVSSFFRVIHLEKLYQRFCNKKNGSVSIKVLNHIVNPILENILTSVKFLR